MSIVDFLEARIAEDEEVANRGLSCEKVHPREDCYHPDGHPNPRLLRECEAKRAILGRYQALIDGPDWMTDAMVHAWGTMLRRTAIEPMAAIYSDHPDYQPDWTPYTDNFDRADGALAEKLGARWTPSRSSGVAIATNVADNTAQAPNALRVETLQLGDVTFELPPYVALQPGDLVTWVPAGDNVKVKVTRADAEVYDYFGPAIRRASAEVQAFDRHVEEHGCGDPKNPNYNRGIWHCPEGRRLWDAIDRDDPDFPVPMA